MDGATVATAARSRDPGPAQHLDSGIARRDRRCRPGPRGGRGAPAPGLAHRHPGPQRAGAGPRKADRPATGTGAPAQCGRGCRGLADRRRRRVPGQQSARDPARRTGRAQGVRELSQDAGALGATFEVLSAAEAGRVTALYAPLAEAVRELIDATIRTEADDDVVAD